MPLRLKVRIYLTVKFNFVGKKAGERILQTQPDVTSYLLDEAKLAIVPFYAFGASNNSAWYRLSVGTCRKEGIKRDVRKTGDCIGKDTVICY